MVKVPRIERFRGDYEQSWDKWILRFEAESKALATETAEDKRWWRDMLTVCTAGYAFTSMTKEIAENANTTCATIKRSLKTKYSGEVYKRHLSANLQDLKFRDQRVASHPKRHKESIYVILENNLVNPLPYHCRHHI